MVLDLKLQNDILIATFPKNAVITELLAKQIVEERLAFQKGVDYPVLINLNGVKYISSAASTYFKTHGLQGIKSAAFIITTPVENIMLRFFLTYQVPSVATKTFIKNEEGEALKWLNQFMS